MRQDLIVSESIDIDASPVQVWKALTDPDIIKEYLFGTQTITDWQVGSDITFQGEYNGQTYKDKGIVRQNTPNTLLSYSYWSGFSGTEDKPENYSLVTYRLASQDHKKTTFTWEQKGFANEEGYQHSKTGMPAFIQSIKEAVEKRA